MTEAPSPPDVSASAALIASLHARIAALQRSHESLMRAVAHDLRAPLRHVNSLAPLLHEAVQELASHTSADPATAHEALECAAMMQSAAQRMAQMLEGLAAVSRASRAALAWQPLDAAQLVQSVAATLRGTWPSLQLRWVDDDGQAGDSGVEENGVGKNPALSNHDSLNAPAGDIMLAADRQWLAQLLTALLDNACKFSAGLRGQPVPDPLPITLSARLVNSPLPQPLGAAGVPLDAAAHIAPDCHWRLTIADAGVGFDLRRAEHLFAPFARMHRDSDYAGVGCGLALAHTVAERHGASIHIHTAPQQGCVVQLLWPAAAVVD